MNSMVISNLAVQREIFVRKSGFPVNQEENTAASLEKTILSFGFWYKTGNNVKISFGGEKSNYKLSYSTTLNVSEYSL